MSAKPAPHEQWAAPEKTTDRLDELDRFEGFFNFYWDPRKGALLLEIDSWNEDFLYVTSLQRGVGSNHIGLDRGQLGETRVVRFERVGPKVFLIQPNMKYRSSSVRPEERLAVETSFASSALYGFEALELDDTRALIDFTPFLLQDSHDIASTLDDLGEGAYAEDASRSAVFTPACRSFADNTELEAMVTFKLQSGKPGPFIRDVAPSPESFTVHLHHSFIRLPDSNYTPRRYDPRSGAFVGAEYLDYSVALGAPLRKLWIARHRLEKRDPSMAQSEVVEPIVYYMDPGVPEPIKSALKEGAEWWNAAFESSGFLNAFRVEDLPENADPMDIRYNLIQWTHRSTRGWSYGSTVIDPRTGEILKGKVTLGSLRAWHDHLIAQGLLTPYVNSDSEDPRMEAMALARLRQLAAHEVGHTLGFRHNFAASADGMSSVMDYPHPNIQWTEDGELDISNAYDTGIGDWDKFTVAYAYSQYPDGVDETEELSRLLNDAERDGRLFITDGDARASGGAHPTAHLWDNGTDAVAELRRVVALRAHTLSNFSEQAIRFGQPIAELDETLAPIFHLHRYQTEAAVKLIGGLEYRYTVRGGQPFPPKPIPPERQIDALTATLETIDPKFLTLPNSILRILPPRPPGHSRTRESFASRLGITFDPVFIAESAADETLNLLMHPERLGRLSLQKAMDESSLGSAEVLEQILEKTWRADRFSGLSGEIQKAIELRVLERLFVLCAATHIAPQAQADAFARLQALESWIERSLEHGRPTGLHTTDEARLESHYQFAMRLIHRFKESPEDFQRPSPTRIPPGSPIGGGPHYECAHY